MKTALLVLDFINDIVHPDGKIATAANFVSAKKVIEQANFAINFARQQDILTIFIKVGFSANYVECPKHSPVFGKAQTSQALQLNSWGTNFHEELAMHPQDTVIIKHRVSAFYATALEAILRSNQIDRLLLTGVSTNMVIASTACEAHDRDYQVVILEDACGAASEEIHQQALSLLSRMAKIIRVEAL